MIVDAISEGLKLGSMQMINAVSNKLNFGFCCEEPENMIG